MCSGKESCSIGMPNLLTEIHPCPVHAMPYMKVSYKCIEGIARTGGGGGWGNISISKTIYYENLGGICKSLNVDIFNT